MIEATRKPRVRAGLTPDVSLTRSRLPAHLISNPYYSIANSIQSIANISAAAYIVYIQRPQPNYYQSTYKTEIQ